MNKVRWAVVGTSDFALDWIARGVASGKNAELAAIVSRDQARAEAAARRTGAAHAFSSIEAIDHKLVDGVFLVLPNPQHAPFAIEAARRGLHVIVEKPMAPTVAECQSMIAAAKENNVTLAVAHCMEWASPIVRARELVAEGAIGDVISISVAGSFNYPPAQRWRQDDATEAGGGPLMDMGVHCLDSMVRIVGPVSQVTALINHKLYDYPAEDSTTLLLRFANGAHGLMQSHFNCNQNWMDIQGSKGRLYSEPWLGREFAGSLTLETAQSSQELPLESLLVYTPQIEHVSECVLTGQKPVISGERGMANVAIIHAAIESARTGKTVDVG